jgi:hypothetical protein
MWTAAEMDRTGLTQGDFDAIERASLKLSRLGNPKPTLSRSEAHDLGRFLAQRASPRSIDLSAFSQADQALIEAANHEESAKMAKSNVTPIAGKKTTAGKPHVTQMPVTNIVGTVPKKQASAKKSAPKSADNSLLWLLLAGGAAFMLLRK